MRHHDPFLNHVRVLRSGVATEEALTLISHVGPDTETLNEHNGVIFSLCADGVAFHLTLRQSKALRKVLKRLEQRTANF